MKKSLKHAMGTVVQWMYDTSVYSLAILSVMFIMGWKGFVVGGVLALPLLVMCVLIGVAIWAAMELITKSILCTILAVLLLLWVALECLSIGSRTFSSSSCSIPTTPKEASNG